MTTLYLDKHGTVLRRSDERLIVSRGRKEVASVPASKVREIIIFGNSTVTPPALELAISKGIGLSYLTATGKLRGRFEPALSGNAQLRELQYIRTRKNDFCLRVAREIVRAKIQNGARLIQQKGYRSNDIGKEQWHKFRKYDQLANQAKDIDALRGYEGSASASYFKLFAMLLKDDMNFRQRIKHPPPDPINILLSLGYTLLFNMMYSTVNLVGLDPYRGVYHQIKSGHASLVSDLMEEFRSPVIDAVVLKCVNLGVIRRNDFVSEDKKVTLKKEGLKKFVQACEEKFCDDSGKSTDGKRLSFRQQFEYQVRYMANVIKGRIPTYVPFAIS